MFINVTNAMKNTHTQNTKTLKPHIIKHEREDANCGTLKSKPMTFRY